MPIVITELNESDVTRLDEEEGVLAMLRIPYKTKQQLLRTLLGAQQLVHECKSISSRLYLDDETLKRTLGHGADFDAFCTEVSTLLGQSFDPWANNAMDLVNKIPYSLLPRLSRRCSVELRSTSLDSILLEVQHQLKQTIGNMDTRWGLLSTCEPIWLQLPPQTLPISVAELPGTRLSIGV